MPNIWAMKENSEERLNSHVPDEQANEVDPQATEPADLPDGQPVGPDNIREGKVRGVMGGPNQSQGQGQGG